MKYTAKDFRELLAKDPTVLRCEMCGAPVSFYSTEYHAYNLNGKRVCRDCYDKNIESATFICKACGGVFPKKLGKSDFCPECWKKHMEDLRLEKERFRIQLEAALREHGFTPYPIAAEMLDAYGQPAVDVIQENIGGVSPLRLDIDGMSNGSERGIYAVHCRDAVIAYPDNSIGLRFIIPSEDVSFMEKIAAGQNLRSGECLAIAGDANDLFILRLNGMVISVMTGETVFLLFDEEAEIKKITAELPQSAFEKQRAEFLQGDHFIGLTWTETYYNAKDQYFYCTYTSGNAHEGIYRCWAHISKEEVVRALKEKVNIIYARKMADQGLFPEYMIAESLPQTEKWNEFSLPEDQLLF